MCENMENNKKKLVLTFKNGEAKNRICWNKILNGLEELNFELKVNWI